MKTPFVLLLTAAWAQATGGPFPDGPDAPGTDAISADNPAFTRWATAVAAFTPGPQAAGTTSTPANYGSTASALGPPDAVGASYAAGSPAPVLSLGDGGQITLRFSPPIADGEGPDFAIFENGFTTSGGKLFAELAFVEVSSDGVNFTRFPAVSCTQTATQTGNFGSTAPSDLQNLAGKHPAGYGTPFDLATLGMTRAAYVRLIDVVGDVRNGRGSRDSMGNWINDPWPTNFQTSGFDLDAVGVIHSAPDAWSEWIAVSFDPVRRQDPALTAPDADPDGDGKTNLMEYAFGTRPDSPESVPALLIQNSGNGLTLEYRYQNDRDTATVLQELTPTGWAAVTGNRQETGAPQVTVTVALPSAAARGMFRLRITRP